MVSALMTQLLRIALQLTDLSFCQGFERSHLLYTILANILLHNRQGLTHLSCYYHTMVVTNVT